MFVIKNVSVIQYVQIVYTRCEFFPKLSIHVYISIYQVRINIKTCTTTIPLGGACPQESHPSSTPSRNHQLYKRGDY